MNFRSSNGFATVWKSFQDQFSPSDHFVLDALYSEGAIDSDLFQRLLRIENQTELLEALRLLINTTDETYAIFKNILKNSFGNIHHALEQMELQEQTQWSNYEEVLRLGDVPKLPTYYVERTSLKRNLRTCLNGMDANNNKLVVHGIVGNGKSSLVQAAISDKDLLLSKFKNKVYWVKTGNITHVDDPKLQDILCRLFKRITINESRSVIELPAGQVPGINLIRDCFRLLFTREPYRDTLFVLDDVHSADVVDVFDNGCNVVAIARERIATDNAEYFHVIDGFTEEESLHLLAQAMDIDFERIQAMAQPRLFHHYCRGDPFVISASAKLINKRKDGFINNDSLWKRLYVNNSQDCQSKRRNEAIKQLYNNMDEETRQLVKHLSIFPEDVNLTTHVFRTLWHLDNDENALENIIDELCDKNFLYSAYNATVQEYVYGINDVYLAFLKSTVSHKEQNHMHAELVRNYKNLCDGNFAKLPNDDYIYQYLPYHLMQAACYNDFRIFFDLLFLEAKIRTVGVADVLGDFDIYKKWITKSDNALEEKRKKYKEFIEMYGQNLFYFPSTSIVQSGLNLHSDHPVYKEAKRIMADDHFKLYFQLHAPHESNYFTNNLTLLNNFKAACFTNQPNEIIVGTERGDIELWHQHMKNKLLTFEGHTQEVIALKMNYERDRFLSISKDGTAKLWKLKLNYKRSSNGFIQNGNEDTFLPSPKLKQNNHMQFFGNDPATSDCLTLELTNDKILAAAFANNSANLVVTGSAAGAITLWEKGTLRQQNGAVKHPILSISFSNDDTLILCNTRSAFYIFEARSVSFIQLQKLAHLNTLHVVPFDNENSVVVVQDQAIAVYEWEQTDLPNRPISISKGRMIDNRFDYALTCSSIIDNYVVFASADSYIRMFDIKEKAIVEEFPHENKQVTCLDTVQKDTDESIQVLLSGFEDKTMTMWHVRPNMNESKEAKNLPIFACCPLNEKPLIAVATSNSTIRIMHSHKLLVETEEIHNDQIVTIVFESFRDRIFYGLFSGKVFAFSYRNRETTLVMHLHTPVDYLEFVSDGILVAGGRDGTLLVSVNGVPKQLNKFCGFKASNPLPVLKSFYISNTLITIARRRNVITAWTFDKLSARVLDAGNGDIETGAACVSNDKSLLCLVAGNDFHVFSVTNCGELQNDSHWGRKVAQKLCSCQFSSTNEYLAIGCENGDILIWILKSRTCITLTLHKSSVRSIVFSPTEAFMVSVGEQIAWWDLKKIPVDRTRSSVRSRSNSTTKKGVTGAPLSLQISSISSDWLTKRGGTDKPHLLAAIKLKGSHADTVFASGDFGTFLTVDNRGELYIFDMIGQHRAPSS